jgi:hypothetical protein
LTRFWYPVSVFTGGVVGYKFGPLAAPYLERITERTWLSVVGLKQWFGASQWLSLIVMVLFAAFSYKNLETIVKLRLIHTMSYYRLRDDVKTPGNMLRDIVWAYSYGAAQVSVMVLSVVGCVIWLPMQSQDFLLQVGLFMLGLNFLPAVHGFLVDILNSAFEPKKLKEELEQVGIYQDLLRADSEELEQLGKEAERRRRGGGAHNPKGGLKP